MTWEKWPICFASFIKRYLSIHSTFLLKKTWNSDCIVVYSEVGIAFVISSINIAVALSSVRVKWGIFIFFLVMNEILDAKMQTLP